MTHLLRLLIRTLCALLFVAFGVGSAFSAPGNWTPVSYPVTTQELSAQPVNLTNAARAPPPASANVMATGTAFAQTGNLRALDGVDTTGAVYAFLRSTIATNTGTGRSPWTQVSSDARSVARDIESATGRALPQNQRNQLAEQLREVDHRNPVSDADYANLQREYRRNRTQMIREWENNTGQSWPEGAQLHHVIPQRYGGPNQWWNAHPALPSQHQGGIHGTGSPTQTVFPTPVPRQ